MLRPEMVQQSLCHLSYFFDCLIKRCLIEL